MIHTWLSVDDHLLPRMGCWVVAAVCHVLAGPKLEHLHEAQRHAPLQKELLVEWGIAAATPTAILTSGHSRRTYRLCDKLGLVHDGSTLSE